MTYAKFNTLTFWQQVQLLGTEGIYRAQREEDNLCIELWHLPSGYFVEAFFRPATRRLVALRSLDGRRPYLAGISLPSGCGAAGAVS